MSHDWIEMVVLLSYVTSLNVSKGLKRRRTQCQKRRRGRKKDKEVKRFTRKEIKNVLLGALALCDTLKDSATFRLFVDFYQMLVKVGARWPPGAYLRQSRPRQDSTFAISCCIVPWSASHVYFWPATMAVDSHPNLEKAIIGKWKNRKCSVNERAKKDLEHIDDNGSSALAYIIGKLRQAWSTLRSE